MIVGTRPDCMPEGLLDYFAELSQRKFVMIEYGLESTLDKTLVRINRGHTHEESESAIRRTAAKGIYTGAHLILGLPGESRDETLHLRMSYHASRSRHLTAPIAANQEYPHGERVQGRSF